MTTDIVRCVSHKDGKCTHPLNVEYGKDYQSWDGLDTKCHYLEWEGFKDMPWPGRDLDDIYDYFKGQP